ncbi:MAG: PorV/PorQ family protein [Bacteroidota bacterium]
MRLLLLTVLTLTLVLGAAPTSEAQNDIERDKLAQTGMKFLSISADPRAAAMGSAATAREGGSAMLFYNPAGMVRFDGAVDAMFGQTQWIADISYNFGSIAYRPLGGRLGVIGVSLTFADYGDLQQTIFAENEQGYLVLDQPISPQAWSVGVGYARALTDRFSVGGQIKYASQDLGDSVQEITSSGAFLTQANQEGVVAYDFGVLYKTGFRSLNFAVSARNFAPEVTFEQESFQLPLTLQIGVSMDVLDLTEVGAGDVHQFVVAVDANNPRDFSEQIKLGGEYTFANTFSVRGGYVFPADQESISLGAGLQQSFGGIGFGADYAYTNFGVFDAVQRIGFRLMF